MAAIDGRAIERPRGWANPSRQIQKSAVEAILNVDGKGRGAPSPDDFARADPCSLPNRPSPLPVIHWTVAMEGAAAPDALEKDVSTGMTTHGARMPRFAPQGDRREDRHATRAGESLEDERRHFETSARLASGQRQEDRCRQRVRRITSIVARLRTEIAARANASRRNPVTRSDSTNIRKACSKSISNSPRRTAPCKHTTPREYRRLIGDITESTAGAGIAMGGKHS